jgi:hypothetical protein
MTVGGDDAAIRGAKWIHSLLQWLKSIIVQGLADCKLHCAVEYGGTECTH